MLLYSTYTPVHTPLYVQKNPKKLLKTFAGEGEKCPQKSSPLQIRPHQIEGLPRRLIPGAGSDTTTSLRIGMLWRRELYLVGRFRRVRDQSQNFAVS